MVAIPESNRTTAVSLRKVEQFYLAELLAVEKELLEADRHLAAKLSERDQVAERVERLRNACLALGATEILKKYA